MSSRAPEFLLADLRGLHDLSAHDPAYVTAILGECCVTIAALAAADDPGRKAERRDVLAWLRSEFVRDGGEGALIAESIEAGAHVGRGS